jgi:hypothetical protein
LDRPIEDASPTADRPESTRPELSICVPTYNRADILRGTLEHLLAVCGPDVEVVVTDNASTDHTGRVIAEAAPRFRHFRAIRHEANLGAMKNIASGLALATGRYCYTLSDDDALCCDGIEEAVRVLDADPGVSAVYGGFQAWDRAADRVLSTHALVGARADFARGEQRAIFDRFTLLWFPVCRTRTYQRFFSYDDDAFGMWTMVATFLEHGAVAVLPAVFYKHAQTVPRLEFELTEGARHDGIRAQFEAYVGRLGPDDPAALAAFISARVSPAYLQGHRFATMKGEMLKARYFMLRARAYGLVPEAAVMEWERQTMVYMVAERLLDIVGLVPDVAEVLFEPDPRLGGVRSWFAHLAPRYRVGDLADAAPPGAGQYFVTYDYGRFDATRARAVADLLEGCRVTDQPLAL